MSCVYAKGQSVTLFEANLHLEKLLFNSGATVSTFHESCNKSYRSRRLFSKREYYFSTFPKKEFQIL